MAERSQLPGADESKGSAVTRSSEISFAEVSEDKTNKHEACPAPEEIILDIDIYGWAQPCHVGTLGMDRTHIREALAARNPRGAGFITVETGDFLEIAAV